MFDYGRAFYLGASGSRGARGRAVCFEGGYSLGG